MVLVEPEIILNAPQQYLLAGIGDTLAKWYEAVVLAPQPETLPLTVRLGINNAQAIRDVLLNSSEQALADQQNQQLTQSFCDVEQKTLKSWQAVWLENDYIKVMILPELGGRVHRAWDKVKQRDFVYHNEVIKPALVGLLGPWISGGIELMETKLIFPTTAVD